MENSANTVPIQILTPQEGRFISKTIKVDKDKFFKVNKFKKDPVQRSNIAYTITVVRGWVAALALDSEGELSVKIAFARSTEKHQLSIEKEINYVFANSDNTEFFVSEKPQLTLAYDEKLSSAVKELDLVPILSLYQKQEGLILEEQQKLIRDSLF